MWVDGYLNLEFEGDAIYLHKEDYDYHMLKNALWVRLSEKLHLPQNAQFYSKKHVSIIGRFNMHSHGHLSLFSGSIENVERIDILDSSLHIPVLKPAIKFQPPTKAGR